MTVGRLEALTGEASRLTERQPMSVGSTTTSAPGDLLGAAPIPVELHQPRPALPQVLARVLASVWGPVMAWSMAFAIDPWLNEPTSRRRPFICR
jgi:hypothetical protein